MIRRFILIILLMLLTGCVSNIQTLGNVNPGMSPQEVEAIMGRRDSFKSIEKDNATYTLYQYTNRYCANSFSSNEKCDFLIIFKDNKVIETGVNTVRSNNLNMIFLYLFQ